MDARTYGDAIHVDKALVLRIGAIAPVNAPHIASRELLDLGDADAQPEMVVKFEPLREGAEIGEIFFAIPDDRLGLFSVGVTAKGRGQAAARQPQGAIVAPVDAANGRGSLEGDDIMPRLLQLVHGRQPCGTRTDHGDSTRSFFVGRLRLRRVNINIVFHWSTKLHLK